VFDRDTGFNFLPRALNPRPSLRGGRGHPRHPVVPRGSPRTPRHGCKGRRGLWGTSGCPLRPRVSPQATGRGPVPASPPWELLSEGRWVWGKGKRSPKQAPELNRSALALQAPWGCTPSKDPPRCTAAMCPTSPCKVPAPSPCSPTLLARGHPALHCTGAASPRLHQRPPWQSRGPPGPPRPGAAGRSPALARLRRSAAESR